MIKYDGIHYVSHGADQRGWCTEAEDHTEDMVGCALDLPHRCTECEHFLESIYNYEEANEEEEGCTH